MGRLVIVENRGTWYNCCSVLKVYSGAKLLSRSTRLELSLSLIGTKKMYLLID